MAKKIEVDIAYLKSIGLSQKQISDIIKNAEPDHWTNKLPEGIHCYELLPFMISPESRLKERVTIYCGKQNDPALSFFKEKDAEFIQNKCRLLIEMSNFSFAVNDSWSPDWNDKDEKKHGIVLQNGQARVSENELFNLYVFGIVTRSRSLALEMLEEFKERIEAHFNKPFNSVTETVKVEPILFSTSGINDSGTLSGTSTTQSLFLTGVNDTFTQNNANMTKTINNTVDYTEDNFHKQNNPEVSGSWFPVDKDGNVVDSFVPRYETVSNRKKKKFLITEDIEKIQEMLLQNVYQNVIAEKLNYSQGTISRVKKQLGFNMRKKNNIDEV